MSGGGPAKISIPVLIAALRTALIRVQVPIWRAGGCFSLRNFFALPRPELSLDKRLRLANRSGSSLHKFSCGGDLEQNGDSIISLSMVFKEFLFVAAISRCPFSRYKIEFAPMFSSFFEKVISMKVAIFKFRMTN